MGEWKLVWESDEYSVEVKPEMPFQPRIEVITENLRVPSEAIVNQTVYCGDIQIRTNSTEEVRWRAVTLVNEQETAPREDYVKLGVVKTYVPHFTPTQTGTVKLKIRVFEWVE